MSLLKWVTGMINRAAKNLRAERERAVALRRETRLTAKPTLEALEVRLVPAAGPPAVDVWQGTVSNDWNDSRNWQTQDASGNVLPQNQTVTPGAGIGVIIQDPVQGGALPVIGVGSTNTAAVCANLLDTSHTGLTINSGSSLDVQENGTKGFSIWGDAADNPTLYVGGKLQFDSGNNQTMSWNNGDITGSGTIYLNNGATFKALNNATNLGATLYVGMDGLNEQQQVAQSTFQVSDALAKNDAMTNNLTLNNNVNIYIESKGNMSLAADSNQNTRGGIVYGSGYTGSDILVYGTVQVTADSARQVMTIQPYVSILGGMWIEYDNAQTRFMYAATTQNSTSVYVAGTGVLYLHSGSNLQISGGAKGLDLEEQGMLMVPSAGNASASVQGNILDNGTIKLRDANGPSALSVQGNVDIETGGLDMYIDWNNDGTNTASLLSVSGAFYLDMDPGAYSQLWITTNGNVPANQSASLIYTGQGIWYDGFSSQYYFDSVQVHDINNNAVNPSPYLSANIANGDYTLET